MVPVIAPVVGATTLSREQATVSKPTARAIVSERPAESTKSGIIIVEKHVLEANIKHGI
jgi:hypothetical protein